MCATSAANSKFRFVGNSNKNNEYCRFYNVVITGSASEEEDDSSSDVIGFDGVDDYIDFGNSHDYTDDLTIEGESS